MSFVTTPSPLPIWMGGTGQPYLTPGRLILGNGYNPVLGIAPGPANSVLGSDGSTWVYFFVYKSGSDLYLANNFGGF